jgi:hypothetical protein
MNTIKVADANKITTTTTAANTPILAIDLGKYKSLVFADDEASGAFGSSARSRRPGHAHVSGPAGALFLA